MDRDLIQDYLQRARMEEAQAQALSRILVEMATKSELVALEERLTSKIEALEARFTLQMEALETRFASQMAQLRAEIMGQMAQLESRLTWRMIAVVGFFATAATVLNAFIG